MILKLNSRNWDVRTLWCADAVFTPLLLLELFPKLIPETPPDLTAHIWLCSNPCRCQYHGSQQNRAMWKLKVCVLPVSLFTFDHFFPIQHEAWQQKHTGLKTVGGITHPQSTAGAPLSCYLFFSLQRLHLWAGEASPPSFGRKKKKQMAFDTPGRQRGHRRVSLRLRPKAGVSLRCLVNNEIQSLWLPIPLSVWG